MSRRNTALVLAGVLCVLGLFAVAGHSQLSGPTLFAISATHGVHRDDLIALAAWLIGMACAWRIYRD